MQTHDCPPTLTDRDVIRFCRDGYLESPSAVDRAVTDRVLAWLAEHGDHLGDAWPLLDEDWFIDGFVLNGPAVGCHCAPDWMGFADRHGLNAMHAADTHGR